MFSDSPPPHGTRPGCNWQLLLAGLGLLVLWVGIAILYRYAR